MFLRKTSKAGISAEGFQLAEQYYLSKVLFLSAPMRSLCQKEQNAFTIRLAYITIGEEPPVPAGGSCLFRVLPYIIPHAFFIIVLFLTYRHKKEELGSQNFTIVKSWWEFPTSNFTAP